MSFEETNWLGHCYAAAFLYAASEPSFKLAHGEVILSAREGRGLHAWAENENEVVDMTASPRRMSKAQYYRQYEPSTVKHYAAAEAIANEDLGPWGSE